MTPVDAVRVLVVLDDNPDVRQVIRLVLARSEIPVEAEASSVTEAVAAVAGQGPGIIVIDDELGDGRRGTDGVAELMRAAPEAKVVVFSGYHLDPVAGANPAIAAFIPKDRLLDLPMVITAVAAGERFVDLTHIDDRRDAQPRPLRTAQRSD